MSELNQSENNSKEFFMEIGRFPSKEEFNQGSTKAQSSLNNISQSESKDEEEEEKTQKNTSMIFLKEEKIIVKNTEEEIKEQPKAIDPAYQKEVNDYFKEPKNLSDQIPIQMEEESEENNSDKNNEENLEDNSHLNILNNSPYDNRELIPIQPWEKNIFYDNKKESTLIEDEKLNNEEINVEMNRHPPNVPFLYEEENALTINYDEMVNEFHNYERYDTNYESEDDQG